MHFISNTCGKCIKDVFYVSLNCTPRVFIKNGADLRGSVPLRLLLIPNTLKIPVVPGDIL